MVGYIQTGNEKPDFVPVSDFRVSAPIILVIDGYLDEPHLQHLQNSVYTFVDLLLPTMRLGIVLYGRIVSGYDFSEESIASANVLPEDKSPNQDSLKALIYGTGIDLSPMQALLTVSMGDPSHQPSGVCLFNMPTSGPGVAFDVDYFVRKEQLHFFIETLRVR
ncbi:hypothetical protein VNO77_38997 [Canavalia gladiata]|uniref:Protein transport protein SEC23 n=1 Tax=Canavalia gladiata TaxID=3824 RepID=A0AAN9KCB7_CANGL